MLAGGTLLGLGALLRPAAAQTDESPWRIDLHHHLTPPGYVAKISGRAPVSPPSANWTVAKSLDDMRLAGVAKAMLSISTPGLWFGDVAFAAALARECNEYGATLVRDHPDRFGLFAALPLPDVDASLREIAYGLDTLHASGVAMFTSYGGKWLGDPAFAPVFEELNRRRAVVFTHPTTSQCCGNLIPFIPDPAIEFATDTTRAIASLVFSGAAARYPDMRIVFSHAGGTMPMLIERFQFIARDPAMAAKTGIGLMPLLRRFHYDTAQAANPAAMSALRAVVPVTQVLFGTDFPYRRAEEHVTGLAGCGFTNAELLAIDRGNAERLLGMG
jgi:predicted TIM-barrel fold metal-dependent hydrolase